VYQNTSVDWKNVRLTISSSNPEQSNISPTLNPNYLDFNYSSSYQNNNIYQLKQNIGFNKDQTLGNISEVYGIIMDEEGTPLPGVNVVVKSSTIGTITDLEGRYKLTLPPNAQALAVSCIGYTM